MRAFPQTTVEMADMISDNMKCCSEWDREVLLGWVQWFVNRNRYLAVSDKGKLVGVALLRLVDSEEDCKEDYKDTEGELCFIEATVCKHPIALKSMFTMMFDRFGKGLRKMAWVRHKYGERVTVVDMDRAKRRLMRN